MPLLKRARIEVYLPERNDISYSRLQQVIEKEFLATFGGCTVIRNIKGLYVGSNDEPATDQIDLVYADTPFKLDGNLQAVLDYIDQLQAAAIEASQEESILVVVHEIYHSL
ncbi:MAG: hypothetical protein ACR2IH_03740 [Pyrinomonadaceae bacterium]